MDKKTEKEQIRKTVWAVLRQGKEISLARIPNLIEACEQYGYKKFAEQLTKRFTKEKSKSDAKRICISELREKGMDAGTKATYKDFNGTEIEVVVIRIDEEDVVIKRVQPPRYQHWADPRRLSV